MTTTAVTAGHDRVSLAVRGALARVLNRPIGEIGPESTLEGDLGLDSITLIHANIAIEEDLRIAVPTCEGPETALVTVADLIEFVEQRFAAVEEVAQ